MPSNSGNRKEVPESSGSSYQNTAQRRRWILPFESPASAGSANGDGPHGTTDAADGWPRLHPEQYSQKQNVLAVLEESLAQVPGPDYHPGWERGIDSEESDPQPPAWQIVISVMAFVDFVIKCDKLCFLGYFCSIVLVTRSTRLMQCPSINVLLIVPLLTYFRNRWRRESSGR